MASMQPRPTRIDRAISELALANGIQLVGTCRGHRTTRPTMSQTFKTSSSRFKWDSSHLNLKTSIQNVQTRVSSKWKKVLPVGGG